MCDLVGVAVEHERFAADEIADAALGRLGPARMIGRRIHIGPEAVFGRDLRVPGRCGLVFGKRDAHDGFDGLEAVLPRHNKANGRAVLIKQRLTVGADR